MTALVLLTLGLVVIAAVALGRIRSEHNARRAAERKLAEMQALADQHEQHLRDVYPVFAHELRSPISAILGYEELLGEGMLGAIDPRAREALQRIRTAALQLSTLADGIERLGSDGWVADVGSEVESSDIIAYAVDELLSEAQARDISLVADGPSLTLRTVDVEARRAVMLALGAAIKASPGAALRLAAAGAPTPVIRITGTRLNPVADAPAAAEPPTGRHLTGAGLRLSFAAAAARLAGGSVTLEPASTGADILIELPSAVD